MFFNFLKIKLVFSLFLLFFFIYFGKYYYKYFFSKIGPSFNLSGLMENNYYSGDVECVLNASDNFNLREVSIFLDGKPLIDKFKIKSRQFEQSFKIPTKTLNNGLHTLEILVRNSLFNPIEAKKNIRFFVDNVPIYCAFSNPDLEYRTSQGRTCHIKFQVNKEIKKASINIFSKEFNCFQDLDNILVYEAFIPIDCDKNPDEYPFSIKILDKPGNSVSIGGKCIIDRFPFKRGVVKVNSEKMKKEKEAASGSKDIYDMIDDLTKASPNKKLWSGPFYAPTDIQGISTDFGVQRTSQELGRYRHKGIDILNYPRSVVWAPQDGVIAVKDRFAIGGNTVVIDHGCGILSIFLHLDRFADIKVGEKIKKGNPIGTLGKTGYATGYHLHWELRVNGDPVDPRQWIDPDF